MLAQQRHGVDEQVVEVHRPGGVQPALVLGVHLGVLAIEDVLGASRRGSGVDELVLPEADRALHASRSEALGVEAEVADHVAGEAGRVGLVVDRELPRVAEQVGVGPQDAHARRVERGHPHRSGDRADQFGDAAAHLVGRLVGEGDGQDRRRRHALVDEVGDAMGEHPGLARSCAGDDEQRSAAVDDGVELVGVEPGERVDCRRWVAKQRGSGDSRSRGTHPTNGPTPRPATARFGRAIGSRVPDVARDGQAQRHLAIEVGLRSSAAARPAPWAAQHDGGDPAPGPLPRGARRAGGMRQVDVGGAIVPARPDRLVGSPAGAGRNRRARPACRHGGVRGARPRRRPPPPAPPDDGDRLHGPGGRAAGTSTSRRRGGAASPSSPPSSTSPSARFGDATGTARTRFPRR